MGRAPMGGDHPDNVSGTRDQRRGLAGANAGLKIDLLIFGIGTIIGMTLLTAVMAYPVSLALRYRRAP